MLTESVVQKLPSLWIRIPVLLTTEPRPLSVIQSVYPLSWEAFVFAGRFSEAVDDMKEALALRPDLEPAQKCLEQSLKDLTVKDGHCADQS